MRIDDECLRPSRNNFTLVRLILASSVIFSHCYETLLGREERDPFTPILGVPISYLAVDGFFFLSGFLVYRSLAETRGVKRFALARLTRLWPGLLTMIALTVAAGAALTSATLGAYLRGGDTIRFIAGNASFLAGHYTLTGLQCGAGPCNVNGSLWTLPWEARCYVILALLALVGLVGGRAMRFVIPATILGALLWDVPGVAARAEHIAGHGIFFQIDRMDRLWTAFALGIAAFELRRRIPLSWIAAAALVALLIAVQYAAPIAALHLRSVVIGYLVLCGGFLTARRRAVSSAWPDYSYGMYIYAFPVMMLLAHGRHFTSPLLLALANFAATVPLAAASWHFVEKPALDWLRRRQRTAFAADRAREEAAVKPD